MANPFLLVLFFSFDGFYATLCNIRFFLRRHQFSGQLPISKPPSHSLPSTTAPSDGRRRCCHCRLPATTPLPLLLMLQVPWLLGLPPRRAGDALVRQGVLLDDEDRHLRSDV